MFWKLVEFAVRILYFRRFSQAKRIGRAAARIADDPHGALADLDAVGRRLHSSLLPLYAHTRGAALEAAGRLDEARAAYVSADAMEPGSARASLALALLASRQRDMKACRQWLEKAARIDDEHGRTAAACLEELATIADGRRERDFASRAASVLDRVAATCGVPASSVTPADLERCAAQDPAWARERRDDLVVALGHLHVAAGGAWVWGLALDHCAVRTVEGDEVVPARQVDAWLHPARSA